jgi:uncharacterized repeat protein (TIGR03803 family)
VASGLLLARKIPTLHPSLAIILTYPAFFSLSCCQVSYGGGDRGTWNRIQNKPNGKETILHSFTGTDGQNPYDTLLQDYKGNLYGTSSVGGSGNGEGVVFEIAAN